VIVEKDERRGWTWRVAEVLLVWLVFAVFAGWRVPDVNEPHYLGKARQAWNPDWIQGDFFFNSADAHELFFLVFGWPTKWLELPEFALGGRLLAWLFQAWGWTRRCTAVFGRAGWAPLGAALFTAACGYCQMAGEWVVGGFEAKVIAYGLVFFALEAVVRRRWQRVWPLLGLATAIHVLVGGWIFLIAAFVWLVEGRRDLPWRNLWPSALVGIALAGIGLVPALRLNWQVPQQVIREANQIYVFARLRHHLVVQSFPPYLVWRFLGLTLFWIVAESLQKRHHRYVTLFVACALAIGALGTAISVVAEYRPASAAGLLRYYWFRAADVLVPLGATMSGLGLALQLRQRGGRTRYVPLLLLGILGIGHLAERAVTHATVPWPPADAPEKVADYEAWLDVCRWIEQHTPGDARFLTPRLAHTFKWRAQRAEVVNWKDIPQDAAGIVEWWNRIADVHQMPDVQPPRYFHTLAEQPAERLLRLGEAYGADYCVTVVDPPLKLKRLYANRSYCVYKLE